MNKTCNRQRGFMSDNHELWASMANRFEILNSFKGIGEHTCGLWFIGIEEAGVWNEDPERDSRKYEDYSKGHYLFDSNTPKNWSVVWNTISTIICDPANIHRKDCWKGCWTNYKETKLFQKDCGVFQANLYPVGRPDVKAWPEYYKQLFGYGKDDLKKYREHVRQNRFPILRDFWEKSDPKATVCLGKTFWDDFRCMLGLNEVDSQPHGTFQFQIYEDKKVILTPFFGRGHMGNGELKSLHEILKGWKALPTVSP